MASTFKLFGALGVAATLAACGATPGERAATGALTGAAVAQVAGESAVNGALIGGAIGGIAPCVTNPNANGCY
ncbi:MAG: hypothetical protein ACJASC_001191 [Limimaricola cinnabarinus]|jgi:hypothetical protein|uniref:Lipoprotein n=1 Tax=Limimaricola cinnabarinus LL-001 TaxID=1337093 RepID=U2YZ08_9RHOB|nr:hypothetical protein [Limimaricola cinnabarinus]GAD54057.1 hypothetical protein MBELCI_0109 [Limimaricola cinnabarinus LL-001]